VALWAQPCSWPRSALRKGQRTTPTGRCAALADGGGRVFPAANGRDFPGAREMGPPASVHVDIDGESIWLSSAATRQARCRSRAAAASASIA